MKKSFQCSIIYTIALFSVLLLFISSCTKVPAGPSSTALGSASQSTVSANSITSEMPTPTDMPLLEQSEAATTITAEELGMDSLSIFSVYWSPDAKYAIFEGILDRQIENVYLYNTQDKKITKILDDFKDVNLLFQPPQWSEDSTLIVFSPYLYDSDVKEYSIYIYDIAQDKLDELPVSGLHPAVSPDKSKVAYFDKDAGLSVFNLSSRTTAVIPGKIMGSNPLWYSDNTRIIFKKVAEVQPTPKMEGILMDFCIIDTKKPESIQSIMAETGDGSMTWLIQDELVWNISVGEGVSIGALDLDSKKYTSFMSYESNGTIYHIDCKGAQFILFDQEKDYRPGFKLLDRNMVEQGKYLLEIADTRDALSVLPDGALLCLSQKQNVNTIMLSYLNAKKIVALSTVEGFFIIARSKNGAGVALISKFGDKMVLIDTMKIKVP